MQTETIAHHQRADAQAVPGQRPPTDLPARFIAEHGILWSRTPLWSAGVSSAVASQLLVPVRYRCVSKAVLRPVVRNTRPEVSCLCCLMTSPFGRTDCNTPKAQPQLIRFWVSVRYKQWLKVN